jgi:hypothetical protein
MKAIVAVSTLAVCLAGLADLTHAQQQRRRAARRSESVTTVTNPGSVGRFTREVVTVKVRGTQRCLPPHVAGDDDFAGNGPYVRVRVQFLVHNNAVYRRLYMLAKETGSTAGGLGGIFGGGGTEAEGWSGMQHVWTPPAGKTIFKLLGISETSNLVSERLHGHGKHVRNTAVGRMEIYGDQKWGEAGRRTYVDVDFNYDLPVMVQDYSSNFVRVHLPRTVEYEPPHIEGDADFKGHGPRVNISVFLTRSARQLTFNISMHARETKSDWTTASGRYSKVIFTAPAGKVITGVQGKQNWGNVVHYTDTDHEVDTFNHPELGPIHVYGDTFLKDADYTTRVIFANIQRSVLVELADE